MSISQIIRTSFDRLSERAQSRILATRQHLLTAWIVSEDGCDFATVTADDIGSAVEQARDDIDTSVYDTSRGTVYADIRVRNAVTGEESEFTLSVDQDEPECSADDHDWQSPYEVLGGIKENPGVWGNGGGVIISEVCAHCGAYRKTNTWAQRRDTGEQGLTEVTYQDADDASLSWVRDQQAAAVRSALEDIIDVRHEDGDGYVYADISDERDEDGEPVDSSAEDTLREINAALQPLNLVARWTGSGNTDEDGASTSEISIELN